MKRIGAEVRPDNYYILVESEPVRQANPNLPQGRIGYPALAGVLVQTGFSQGGIVTLALALYHDDVVGAALPMSSWLPC